MEHWLRILLVLNDISEIIGLVMDSTFATFTIGY